MSDSEGPSKKRSKADEEKKRRSSKACDQCRRTKCKCALTPEAPDGPCHNCVTTGQQCTFLQTSKKRGPPKGYIDAVESRLHRMEALLGNLLENEDPRAQALLSELIGDDEARELFTQDLKAAAQAGPDSKARRSWIIASSLAASQRQASRAGGSNGVSSMDGVLDPTLAGDKPRNARKRKATTDALLEPGTPPQSSRFPGSPADGTIAHTGFAAGTEPSSHPLTELADVVGQLSLDENSEIRYHGRSSGLYLISNSARYQNFFWRFPKGGIWPAAIPKDFTEANLQRERQLVANALAILPDEPVQARLLQYYWSFVHPHFPILHREWFQAHYANTSKMTIKALGTPVPLFLLLVMLALAARYKEPTDSYVEGTHWPAGDDFLYHARALMALEDFGGSHLSSVQGLLLLAYCQIGTGAMANSWNMVGQAIRMGQDLGLFRDADRWFMPTMFKFSREEIQSRKRAWWGCIVMDKYVSAYIGRPMGINERDWDTSLPSEDEKDEIDEWHPLMRDGRPYPGMAPNLITHSISCFNRCADLSIHISRIISNIYAIRIRVLGQSSETLLAHLDQGLAKFYLNLPAHLQYTPSNQDIPLPAVLTLHCQFFTALILLHRPFIPLRSDPATTTTPLPSHAIATTAANAIANIASVFEQTYGLQQATPFMIYYVFTAAIMHVTNARWPLEAEGAKAGLAKCLTALETMRVMWGGAARQMELLSGLVDFAKREPDLSPPLPSTSMPLTAGNPLFAGKPPSPVRSPAVRTSAPTSKGIAVGTSGFEPMPDPYRQQAPTAIPPHFPFANIPATVQAPKAMDVMYDDWLNSFLGPGPHTAPPPPGPPPAGLPPMLHSPMPLAGYPSSDPASFGALYMPMHPPDVPPASDGVGMSVLSRAAGLGQGQPGPRQTSDFLDSLRSFPKPL